MVKKQSCYLSTMVFNRREIIFLCQCGGNFLGFLEASGLVFFEFILKFVGFKEGKFRSKNLLSLELESICELPIWTSEELRDPLEEHTDTPTNVNLDDNDVEDDVLAFAIRCSWEEHEKEQT